MSTERLLDSMTREAARRRDEILAQARAEAERIVREARQRAEAGHAAAVAATSAELDVLAQQGRERAEAEAARGVFVMKDNVLRKSLEAARRRLDELTARPDFGAVLVRLLDEALAAVPEDEPEPEPEPVLAPEFESIGTEPSVPEIAQEASPDLTPDEPAEAPAEEGEEAEPREPNVRLVRVPARHAEALRARIEAAGAQLSAEPGPADGVIVEDSWGTFRVTNTLSLRLSRLEGEIRTEAYTLLFGREGRQS